jgi:hypothetical protein
MYAKYAKYAKYANNDAQYKKVLAYILTCGRVVVRSPISHPRKTTAIYSGRRIPQ